MNEAGFNTIFVKTVNATGKGVGYKIPDPPKAVAMMSSQRPFDIIFAYDGKSYFLESKLEKTNFCSFSLLRLAEHQVDWLTKFNNYSGLSGRSLVALCYWEPRKTFDMFLFDWSFLERLLKEGKKSILKKEILELRNKEYFTKISQSSFKIDEALTKIIGEDEWEKRI